MLSCFRKLDITQLLCCWTKNSKKGFKCITTVAYCFGKKKKKKSNIYNSSIIYLTTVTSNGFLAHLQQSYITPDFPEYDIESSNQSDFNHMNFELADGLRKLSHLWISWNTRTHTRGYHNSMPKKSPPSQVFQFTLSTSEQKHAITVLQEHLGLSTCLSAQHM